MRKLDAVVLALGLTLGGLAACDTDDDVDARGESPIELLASFVSQVDGHVVESDPTAVRVGRRVDRDSG